MNPSRESDHEAKDSLDIVAGFAKNQYNKNTLPTSANEALLDEFFSILAGVVTRLIKDSACLDKNGKNTKPEGEKSC